MRYMNGTVLGVLLLTVTTLAWAGSLEPPAAPTDPGSAMYTLEDIYNRLNEGTAGSKRGGAFTEPSNPPDSTGYTLDQVMGEAPAVDDAAGAGAADVANGKTFWGLKSGEWGPKTGTGSIASYPAPVPETGQTSTAPYDAITGSDGDLQKGVSWPDPRWTCYNASKAVVVCTDTSRVTATDNLTGLQWTIDANLDGMKTWANALTYCNGLVHGGYDDWRLPNRFELESLLDLSNQGPPLPSGHPFDPVQQDNYWSSSTTAFSNANAWYVYLSDGIVLYKYKTPDACYVWPVRAGQ